MKRTIHRTVVICAVTIMLATLGIRASDLQGFAEERVAEHLELEKTFDGSLDADNLRTWMKWISAKPHHVSSPHGKAVAEFIASHFEEWGFETTIEEFEILFPTPKKRTVELIAPRRYKAKLAEPRLQEDSTSGVTADRLPHYNAYSIDGDVTAELVYVNYGVPSDYDTLAEHGIDVKGKIVIARYGGSWRGIKPKVAAEHGAIGCILFSDPRDDGYFQGDVYPEGPWKNARGAQRGSVMDMPLYPGDPLTPGVGATKDAKRLAVEDAPTLTKIPVLPISYEDALPLLEAIGGPVAPSTWRGALPITYHLGPGPAKVHLALEFDWKMVTAYNVIAKLVGSESPDEWIIRGNHHDGWVFGASDPTSGMVALMEEARAVGLLAREGWRPKRTIVYAAWDAEEPGLIGSVEWTEAHESLLKNKAVVYINTDSNGRGFLYVGGSHTLESFVNSVARDVEDPQTGKPVLERARSAMLTSDDSETRETAKTRADLPIYALGSGSDYTSFLQHLGIASLNVGFGGENGGGSYHSIFDSFDHYNRFGDPGFAYGVALAKTTGRLTLRLAEADVLPFEFDTASRTWSGYATEIEKLADSMRTETERMNQLILDGHLEAARDPRETFVIPEPKEPVPHINLAPLLNALDHLEKSAAKYSERAEHVDELSNEARSELNQILMKAERVLIRDHGLPRRPWFRHHIYAPGFYTGYGVKTIPGVREAIEQRDWVEAEEQIGIVAEVITAFAGEVDRAVAILE